MATEKNNSAKEAIRAYLDHRAATDSLFAAAYAKPGKNLDECFSYILGEAKKRGSAVCMTDEEVFGLAVHYYDEDDLKVTPVRGSYSASASSKAPGVKLTEEEMKAAREKAIAEYEQQCLKEEARKAKERKEKAAEKQRERMAAAASTPSLFD